MVISIDESGTHRQSGVSVIALVCVENTNILHELDRHVEELEKSIGTSNFHWAYKGWPFRRDFISGLSGLPFTIRLAQINNPIKLDQSLEEILPYLMPERNLERLFIDGKKHKQYARTLKKVLRDKGITVKKLKTVSDEYTRVFVWPTRLPALFDITSITQPRKLLSFTRHLSQRLSLSTFKNKSATRKVAS